MKTIFPLIIMLLLASCVQLDVQEAELEEWIFGEPLPNRAALQENRDAPGDALTHDCSEEDGDETAVSESRPTAPVKVTNFIHVKLYAGLRFLIGGADLVWSSQSLIPRRPFLSWTFA